MRECEDVRNKHPFNELIPVLEEALADRILTEDEKLDILWLCEKLSSKSDFYDQVTNDIQRLHGILGGILADGVVTEKELKGLSEWLMVHGDLKSCWPYDEKRTIAKGITPADGLQPPLIFFVGTKEGEGQSFRISFTNIPI